MNEVIAGLRESYESGKTRTLEWRMGQLRAINNILVRHEVELSDAVHKDLGKCHRETYIFELLQLKNDLALFSKKLESWMQPESAAGQGVFTLLDSCQLRREPFGVVLVIGAWNYPLELLLRPAIAAIAAGNAVVMKPSEVSSNTAALIQKLVYKYCDPKGVAVINGGVPETTQLLTFKFDYIFYTGNPNVGKIVYQAAAKNLTPVTLELGGKSPVIVDESINPKTAAKRICWGKFVNCGQTCIAPDYILVHEAVAKSFLSGLIESVKELYGDDVKNNSHYGKIVNSRHFDRLKSLFDHQLEKNPLTVVNGGKMNKDSLFMEPTILSNIGKDEHSNPIMAEEIFGPFLPVIIVKNIDEAIIYVNGRDKPLSLYIFSSKQSLIERIIDNTSSGSVLVNDVLVDKSVQSLPFGGVGLSGMNGGYHGKWGYDLFSHKKPVMKRPSGVELVNEIRYPSNCYSDTGFTIAKWILESRSRL